MAGASLVVRLALAKAVGFALGLAGFFALPALLPDADPLLRWGCLFWYVTVGAVIGLAGAFDRHPLLGIRLGWWVLGPAIGAWMNLCLALLAHGSLAPLMIAMELPSSPGAVVIGAVLEGALAGALIGGLAAAAGGKGRATAGE